MQKRMITSVDRLANCKEALQTGESLFQIPQVLSPQNMSSRELDELSTLTYLSYYMQKNAPGYKATLGWVKDQIPSVKVDNFDVSCECFLYASTPTCQCTYA